MKLFDGMGIANALVIRGQALLLPNLIENQIFITDNILRLATIERYKTAGW